MPSSLVTVPTFGTKRRSYVQGEAFLAWHFPTADMCHNLDELLHLLKHKEHRHRMSCETKDKQKSTTSAKNSFSNKRPATRALKPPPYLRISKSTA